MVQGFKGSGFKGSRVQGFKGSRAQGSGFKGSGLRVQINIPLRQQPYRFLFHAIRSQFGSLPTRKLCEKTVDVLYRYCRSVLG